MMEMSLNPGSTQAIEALMREELAGNDSMAGTVVPILRHLLANSGHSAFSDEVIARVRGMMDDLARQVLDELARMDGETDRREHAADEIEVLKDALVSGPALLAHVHGLALEWQLTRHLQTRLALDPVLSPLLQSLIASPDPATGALAMQTLAAQARFAQAQQRMKLPLGELPGDLLHAVLLTMRALAGIEPAADERAARAETAIRERHDEAGTRLGLLTRVVTAMGGGGAAALSVGHAGVALFLTALSIASAQDRDRTALCTNDSQLARFALALRAAGLKPEAVEEQFLALHPDVALPEGFERLGCDRAAALLASTCAGG